MSNDRKKGTLEEFLRWAVREEPDQPEVSEDPERAEFLEYLEYLEEHDHMEFGAYRLMRYRERLLRGEEGVPGGQGAHGGEEVDIRAFRLHPRSPSRSSQLRMYRILSVAVTAVLVGALICLVLCLPDFGDAAAPAMGEVARRYLERGLLETGAVNAVTGMILDYRAFDTFGEAAVLFAAAMSVLLLLGREGARDEPDEPCDTLLRQVGGAIAPMVCLFGVYVVVNGHLSPGGGFSGGAILGAGLILTALVRDQGTLDRIIPPRRLTQVTVGCLLLYACMKGYSFYTGANAVGWEIPKGAAGDIFSAGFILPLNLCVGGIVACTMYTFYRLFARRED